MLENELISLPLAFYLTAVFSGGLIISLANSRCVAALLAFLLTLFAIGLALILQEPRQPFVVEALWLHWPLPLVLAIYLILPRLRHPRPLGVFCNLCRTKLYDQHAENCWACGHPVYQRRRRHHLPQ